MSSSSQSFAAGQSASMSSPSQSHRFCGPAATVTGGGSFDTLNRVIADLCNRGNPKEVLFVANISPQTEILHIIDFFENVGEVVSVRLIVNHEGKHVGFGFVEFASAYEAESVRALEKKNGEYLHDHKIFLDVAKTAPYPPRPKYCIDHNVWYEDYLRRESLLVEEDEAGEGLDETPDFEEVAVRKKTLFVANLPSKTKISYIQAYIIRIFKHVAEVVRVRLIVNRRGELVGCAFAEFASANEAKKALERTNGECNSKIFIDVVKTAPYPLRPKYNLAENLWYDGRVGEDYLETKPNLKIPKMDVFCGKKITFSYDDD